MDITRDIKMPPFGLVAFRDDFSRTLNRTLRSVHEIFRTLNATKINAFRRSVARAVAPSVAVAPRFYSSTMHDNDPEVRMAWENHLIRYGMLTAAIGARS